MPSARRLDVPAVIDRLTGSVTATSPAGRSLWLMYRRCPRCRRPNGCAAAEVAGRTGPAAGRTGPAAGRTGPGAGRAGRVDSGLDRAAGRVGNPAGQELAELLPAARSRPLSTRPARPAPGPVRPAAGPVRPAAGPVRPATSAAAQPLGRPAPR